MSGPDTAPRFEWRHRQDTGWVWSHAHTTDGPCPACGHHPVRTCPRCAGRLHREPTIVDDALGEALFCQEERTDGAGRPTRMRFALSAAQSRARLRQQESERRAMWHRWAKNATVAWLTVGTIITIGGLLVALVSMVLYGS